MNVIMELEERLIDDLDEDVAEDMFKELKNKSARKCEQKSLVLRKKLMLLRTERQNVGHDTIERNGGSRKLFGKKYIKERDKGEVFGAPFPKYLRPARRNRPHRRTRVNNNNQEYIVTAEDLEERNPIIASKKDLDISEDAKALYRKGPKFCPTPRGPVDEMEQYKSFLRFQQSVRWKWFFNKDKDPLNLINDDFQAKPWDTRTERCDPIASDAPELEAFLSAIEKDVKNPELRKKIKSNLSQTQWEYIKEVKTEYPKLGLRVRQEDKGARFVIEDAAKEDERIIENLSNPIQYTETEENPIEGFKLRIKNWADDALEIGEIDEKQHKYVTNIEETHMANPKPLYKTHKTDDQGRMLDPIPIRTLTVGCGTPVHPLSKLCQLNIEHLTAKTELPRNSKSTKEVLSVVTNLNEIHSPLPDTA